jgi:hypothetical protein
MRRLSSSKTFFAKRVFPTVWFGFVGCFAVAMIVSILRGHNSAFALIAPVAMLVGGYLICRALVFNLMDEVHLGDGEFVARRGKHEERIPFTTILNISSSANCRPEHVTITIREPRQFGYEISFLPP